MLTPEEQVSVDKATAFVLAFKGGGLSSEEATTMTLGLLGIFLGSAAGAAVIKTALSQRMKRETS